MIIGITKSSLETVYHSILSIQMIKLASRLKIPIEINGNLYFPQNWNGEIFFARSIDHL